MKRSFAIAIIIAASAALPVIGQPVKPQSLAALNGIEPGQWELRSRGNSEENRSICVADPVVLLNLQHSGASCPRFVIVNDQRIATVQYSCANIGNGRTTIRVETPRLVQIESQGTANREPFSIQLEGRRTGVCAATASNVNRR